MVMKGGYGAGQTDKEGNILDPLGGGTALLGFGS